MTAPAGEQQQESGAGGAGSPSENKTFTQSELNGLLAKERRDVEARFEGFDEYKSKSDQFDKLNESTKTELQRANDSAADIKTKYEASQSDNGKLKTQLLRQQVAADKGLPASMWKRVQGETKEEIETDVDDLLTSAGSAGRGSPSGSLRSGASTPGGATDKQRAAAALRGVRER